MARTARGCLTWSGHLGYDEQRGSKRGHSMDRRQFLKLSGLASAGLPSLIPQAAQAAESEKSNFTLRISPLSLEIGPGKVIKTVGYNGTVPGPTLRFREGKPVTVDVYNDTDVPE